MAAGEILLAYALDDTYGSCYGARRRETTPEGKPFFSSSDSVQFNISHSGEYVLVGVDRSSVGVDIQYHIPIQEHTARKVMPDDVFAVWKAQGSRTSAFCDYWVKKESALKWRGVGIGALAQVDAVLPEGVSISPLSAPGGYSAATCGSPTAALRLIPFDQLLTVSR